MFRVPLFYLFWDCHRFKKHKNLGPIKSFLSAFFFCFFWQSSFFYCFAALFFFYKKKIEAFFLLKISFFFFLPPKKKTKKTTCWLFFILIKKAKKELKLNSFFLLGLFNFLQPFFKKALQKIKESTYQQSFSYYFILIK